MFRAFRPLYNAISRSDAYRILGVKVGANPGEIKAAYFKLSQKYHPDKNTECTQELQKKLNLAYALLNKKDVGMDDEWDAPKRPSGQPFKGGFNDWNQYDRAHGSSARADWQQTSQEARPPDPLWSTEYQIRFVVVLSAVITLLIYKHWFDPSAATGFAEKKRLTPTPLFPPAAELCRVAQQ